MTAIDPLVSPCRSHPCSVEHAEIVRGYRDWLAQWETTAEAATGGYASDLAAFVESRPRPQFRDWLIYSRRTQ